MIRAVLTATYHHHITIGVPRVVSEGSLPPPFGGMLFPADCSRTHYCPAVDFAGLNKIFTAQLGEYLFVTGMFQHIVRFSIGFVTKPTTHQTFFQVSRS